MFLTQWNIENFFAPLVVMLFGEILMWFFVQIIEHNQTTVFIECYAFAANSDCLPFGKWDKSGCSKTI